jgi:hypothetical protein
MSRRLFTLAGLLRLTRLDIPVGPKNSIRMAVLRADGLPRPAK